MSQKFEERILLEPGVELRCLVHRKSVKRVNFRIYPDLHVEATLPLRASVAELHKLVIDNCEYIYRARARLMRRHAPGTRFPEDALSGPAVPPVWTEEELAAAELNDIHPGEAPELPRMPLEDRFLGLPRAGFPAQVLVKEEALSKWMSLYYLHAVHQYLVQNGWKLGTSFTVGPGRQQGLTEGLCEVRHEDQIRRRLELFWDREIGPGYAPLREKVLEAPRALASDPGFLRLGYLMAARRFPAVRLVFRRMTSRWGSCQKSTGRICLNTKLVHADPAAFFYVIVHEFCHLVEANHGPRFYALLKELLPSYEEDRRKLRDAKNKASLSDIED